VVQAASRSGATGQQVAFALGRSEGYVNNLIRILERASLRVLVRWRDEQRRESALHHVCATDWLMHVCLLPHATQDEELVRRIASKSKPSDVAEQL